MIINLISSPKGGGAELLVREMHKVYCSRGISAGSLYLSGEIDNFVSGEQVIGVNPRNPLSIVKIRSALKRLSRLSHGKLIVHAHLTWPFFYLPLAVVGLKNVRIIYTEHNTYNKRRGIPMFWLVERIIYRRYSKIICISKGVYESLEKWVGPRLQERLIIVPNGSRIYDLVQRPATSNRKLRLISVGSLSSKKNFRIAINAIARLRDQVESYVIVGEGPERFRLEQLIQQHQLDHLVSLVGWSDQIEEHLAEADIQLIPSVWEGFGLVAVEGMSTGLPIVASDVGGLREVLDPDNPAVTLIADVESVEAWVQGLAAAIDGVQKNGVRSISIAARVQAEKFTLEVMANRYLEIYDGLS